VTKPNKSNLAFVIYVVMMFFTNSYCQVHRWDDWARDSQAGKIDAGMSTISATACWPIYWTSRAFTFAVEHAPTFERTPEGIIIR